MLEIIALVIEMIILCIFFTIMMVVGTKKNPLSGLHNMPIKLQERVASLPQHANVKIIHTKERIIKKIPALFIIMALFVLLIYVSGARSFKQGFTNSFLLWLIIKLYVVFILDCGWLAHTPSAWIIGTEDMEECYKDYRFYMKSIPRSMIAGLIVALIVGMAIKVIG